ncbi:uncharacterized protein [Argopecten irradians]|uniref:uncharacterized protein n=1 Tax=Argopecten irradians TaxID=31199 RepID=UPI00371C3A7B
MNAITSLLAFSLCFSLTRAHCPGQRVFSHTTDNESQTYRLDTTAMCEDHSLVNTEELNICDTGSLNGQLDLAQRHIREARDELHNRVSMRRSLCEVDPIDRTTPSGHSVASTLRNGMPLLLEIALNLTISSCHERSLSVTNLYPVMRDVVCQMQRQCSDLMQTGGVVELTLDHMDRTDLTLFTCRNLRRAHTLIHDFKHDLNSDIDNVPVYRNGD